MFTHRPPNLVVASLYLIGGLLIAACFLVTCFPSSAADVKDSISGNEWGVLVAFVLVGVLAISAASNVLRAAVQAFSQVTQLVVLAAAVWGGIMLYQNQNRPKPLSSTPTSPGTTTDHGASDVRPKEVSTRRHRSTETGSGKWWQDNPYEKD